ncbi:zinc-finger domain-containing protein (plasmid) [Bacillus cereus]|uniref:zinc-finger domain-containing protein n=1 Tax=Bacillus cereus TaxID=1396 RepID=UPI001F1E1C1C|nr:zinc-finger domain-containing protein [Bacillus cereus]UIJ69745.1 zinc-finger domain-containing protein [Bacillus cereus]
MNAKETRIYILDLQDQHCAACEHRTNDAPKYCMVNCKVGADLYRLGKQLAPRAEQVRESSRRRNWETLMPKILEMLQKKISMSAIAGEIGCEANTLRKRLKKMGLWHPTSRKQIQENAGKRWDERCEQAIMLREIGLTYKAICQQLGCSRSGLYQQLEKRGLK